MPKTLTLPQDGESVNTREPLGLARWLAATIRDGLASCWTQLQAVDLVVAEYAEEFNGEDPLRSPMRDCLADALKRIEEAREGLEHYIGPWALPDDHTGAVELIRKLAERVLT
jgi:hypothetical protein